MVFFGDVAELERAICYEKSGFASFYICSTIPVLGLWVGSKETRSLTHSGAS